MNLPERKDINVDLFEGVLFPVPLVIPNTNDTSKTSDSGEVWFDFNRLDLDDYAEMSGRLNMRSALGITEEQLYQSARNHVEKTYDCVDVQLGNYRYITSADFKRITIPYTVSL